MLRAAVLVRYAGWCSTPPARRAERLRAPCFAGGALPLCQHAGARRRIGGRPPSPRLRRAGLRSCSEGGCPPSLQGSCYGNNCPRERDFAPAQGAGEPIRRHLKGLQPGTILIVPARLLITMTVAVSNAGLAGHSPAVSAASLLAQGRGRRDMRRERFALPERGVSSDPLTPHEEPKASGPGWLAPLLGRVD